MKWETHIPLRDGNAMLPTLGMVRFPGDEPAAIARAFTDDGRISVEYGGTEITVSPDLGERQEDGQEGWWRLRTFRAGGDLRLAVTLDDVNPFRDLADPVPPERLDDAGFERWTAMLRDAWSLLCRDHRDDAAAMVDGIVSLVPMAPTTTGETRSASTGEAFGSVLMSEPPDSVDLAVSLVHEYQHIKLGALIHLVPLTGEDGDDLHYAPWRDDPRPLSGLLQGVYAFVGIARFWRRRHAAVSGGDGAVTAYEYAIARGQVAAALRLIRPLPGFTAPGRQLVEALISQVSPWLAEPVAPGTAALADLVLESHRIGWLLRHTRPEPDDVLDLAARRLAREAPPGRRDLASTMVPHPDLFWHQSIPALARRRVIALAGGDPVGNTIPGQHSPGPLTLPDEALVRGDAALALDGYRRWIYDHPAPPDARDSDGHDSASHGGDSHDAARAWAGLAMASARSGRPEAAAVLSARPDLVKHVHARVVAEHGPADPLELATWLAAFGDRADQAD
jgi:HEXXH motif-containing protein